MYFPADRATHRVPRQGLPPDSVGPCDAPAGKAAELLETVRSAVADGKDEADIHKIVEEFAAQQVGDEPSSQVGNSQDPLPIRDAKLFITRAIGQPGEQPQLPLSPGRGSPQVQRGGEDTSDRDEKTAFTEKYACPCSLVPNCCDQHSSEVWR